MSATESEEEVFEAKPSAVRAGIAFAVVMLAVIVGFALFMPRTTIGVRLSIFALGIVAAALCLDEILIRLRVRRSGFVAEYCLRNRVVGFVEVVDMDVESRKTGGAISLAYDALVVRRRHGFSVVMKQFGDEVADPFNALQRRWSEWTERESMKKGRPRRL